MRFGKALSCLLVTDPHREAYCKTGGTEAVMALLQRSTKGDVATEAFTAASQACFKNEDNKVCTSSGIWCAGK